jgi:hypothetical protein
MDELKLVPFKTVEQCKVKLNYRPTRSPCRGEMFRQGTGFLLSVVR